MGLGEISLTGVNSTVGAPKTLILYTSLTREYSRRHIFPIPFSNRGPLNFLSRKAMVSHPTFGYGGEHYLSCVLSTPDGGYYDSNHLLYHRRNSTSSSYVPLLLLACRLLGPFFRHLSCVQGLVPALIHSFLSFGWYTQHFSFYSTFPFPVQQAGSLLLMLFSSASYGFRRSSSFYINHHASLASLIWISLQCSSPYIT